MKIRENVEAATVKYTVMVNCICWADMVASTYCLSTLLLIEVYKDD